MVKIKIRIKDLRIYNDLTQTQVAQAIGITQKKYSHIETEIQSLTTDMIYKLCKFYNVSSDYILGLTDER